MDPLDDAFSTMRVRESLYARLDARAPWAVRFREGKAARFGLVISGACWLTTEAPAQSMALVYQTMAHSISLAMENAQQAQGGLQQIGNAVTSSAVTMIMNAVK